MLRYGGVRARGGMADLADAAAAAMDEGLQEGQEFMDKFTRFLERDVRTPLLFSERRWRTGLSGRC